MSTRLSFSPTLLAVTLVLSAAACASPQLEPEPAIDSALQATVEKRLAGDRSGACLAVGVIEVGREAAPDALPRSRRAYACADGEDSPRIGRDSAFEIGSVSKTMTATLLAGLIDQGKASLDDPLAAYLPEGTEVPTFEGQPILLRHVVTHTSGLPALPTGVAIPDPADPYAAIRPQQLLDALGRTTLPQAPGTKFAYSNFASMLLSYAVTRRTGEGLEAMLDTQLFTPLGMNGAYLDNPPAGILEAEGHMPNGSTVPAWHFDDALAGVGGVRATLDDMLRYAAAELGNAPAPLSTAIERTQQPIITASGQPIAMNWMLAPLNGRTVLAHEGVTGGFSSLVAIDRERGRGVVILSDTVLTALGGLGGLGMHLIDDTVPLPAPRRSMPAAPALLDALVGEWQLEGGPAMSVRRDGDALEVQAVGQPAFEMGYDSAGDFHPLAFDALMSPVRQGDGAYEFVWRQGGGAMPAHRIDDAGAAPTPTLPADVLAGYEGRYPLAPTDMILAISLKDGVLHGQATGQDAFQLVPAGKDVFKATAFGIEIRFQRDADGKVKGLALHQGGNILRGERL